MRTVESYMYQGLQVTVATPLDSCSRREGFSAIVDENGPEDQELPIVG